jgi:hypothetical protein
MYYSLYFHLTETSVCDGVDLLGKKISRAFIRCDLFVKNSYSL